VPETRYDSNGVAGGLDDGADALSERTGLVGGGIEQDCQLLVAVAGGDVFNPAPELDGPGHRAQDLVTGCTNCNYPVQVGIGTDRDWRRIDFSETASERPEKPFQQDIDSPV
jgi:hypothetical protein